MIVPYGWSERIIMDGNERKNMTQPSEYLRRSTEVLIVKGRSSDESHAGSAGPIDFCNETAEERREVRIARGQQ